MDDLLKLPFLNNGKQEDSQSPRISRNSDTNTEEIDYDKTGDSLGDAQVESSFYPAHRRYVNSTAIKAESSRQAVKRNNEKRSTMRQKVGYPGNIVEEDKIIFSDDEVLAVNI